MAVAIVMKMNPFTQGSAGEQTIMDIAGHVSRNMLKHYSHIRMEAKRDALESLVPRSAKKKPLARVNKGIPSMHQVASVA